MRLRKVKVFNSGEWIYLGVWDNFNIIWNYIDKSKCSKTVFVRTQRSILQKKHAKSSIYVDNLSQWLEKACNLFLV